MNVPQIRIRQTLPLIGVNSTIPGKMNIKQPERVIEVQYHPADVEITFHEPEIRVDASKVYHDMGLQSNAARLREYTAKMKEKGLEAIGQIARDGDRVGNIAAGEKQVFRNLAMERFFRENQVEVNVGLVPRHSPEFEVKVRPPNISVRWNQPEVIETGQHLDIRYEPGVVDIYLAVEPSIDIVV